MSRFYPPPQPFIGGAQPLAPRELSPGIPGQSVDNPPAVGPLDVDILHGIIRQWEPPPPMPTQLRVSAGVANVTLALTGVASTTAVGTMTGVAVNGFVPASRTWLAHVLRAWDKQPVILWQTGGIDLSTVSGALTGVSATGSPGTVTPSIGNDPPFRRSVLPAGVLAAWRELDYSLSFSTGMSQSVDNPPRQRSDTFYSILRQWEPAAPAPQQSRPIPIISAGSDVTLALTGVSSMTDVGTVIPGTSVGVTGVEATAAIGAVTASQPITGVETVDSVGALVPALNIALTNVSTTGPPGTVAPSTAPALTGIPATGTPGSVSGGQNCTGIDCTGSPGTASPSNSVALTGSASTTSTGTITPDSVVALTGVATTGSVGAVVPNLNIGLTSVATTCSVGDVSGSQNVTGVSTTCAIGTVTPNNSVALTGVQATGSLGSVSADGSINIIITGVETTGDVGTVIPNTDIAQTGTAASGFVGSVSGAQSITGTGCTGSPGTTAPSVSIALTGATTAAALGTVAPGTSAALTGTPVIGAVGTVLPSTAVALTSVSVTGAVGTVTVISGSTVALTGVETTCAVGDVKVQGAQPELARVTFVLKPLEDIVVTSDPRTVTAKIGAPSPRRDADTPPSRGSGEPEQPREIIVTTNPPDGHVRI
jgi:hypothetical protein